MASHTNERFFLNVTFLLTSSLLLISTALRLFVVLVVVRCFIFFYDCLTATSDGEESDSSWEDLTSSESDEGPIIKRQKCYRRTLRKRGRRPVDT